MCERRIALANTVTEIAGFLCDVEEAKGCCGGPINGVLTGAASPMNTTSPSPPGFVWIGSVSQLLRNHTLPDGSIETPVFSDQSIAGVCIRCDRLAAGSVELCYAMPAEVSNPDVVVAIHRDPPRESRFRRRGTYPGASPGYRVS